jgi:hypothetical protein
VLPYFLTKQLQCHLLQKKKQVAYLVAIDPMRYSSFYFCHFSYVLLVSLSVSELQSQVKHWYPYILLMCRSLSPALCPDRQYSIEPLLNWYPDHSLWYHCLTLSRNMSLPATGGTVYVPTLLLILSQTGLGPMTTGTGTGFTFTINVLIVSQLLLPATVSVIVAAPLNT